MKVLLKIILILLIGLLENCNSLENYEYKEDIPIIEHPNKRGFDTLKFRQQDPFYDDDNMFIIYTGKSTSNFVNYINDNFGKIDTKIEDHLTNFHVVDINEWHRMDIKDYTGLIFRMESYETKSYMNKVKYNVIAIQILDSLGRCILKENNDTTNQLLKYFSNIVDATILKKSDNFSFNNSDKPETDIQPLNYNELTPYIKYPKRNYNDIVLAEYEVDVNEKGKIEKCKRIYNEDIASSILNKYLNPLLSKYQYPILKFNNTPIKYQTNLRIEFAPNNNSFEKSLFDTLNTYAKLDTFESSNRFYQVIIGDVFNCGKKHGIIYYKKKEDYEGFGLGKLTLYEFRSQEWIQLQDFDIYGPFYIETVLDINNDRYNDILIPQRIPIDGSGNTFYNLFLYNPTKGQLDRYEDFEYIEQTAFEPIVFSDEPDCIEIYAGGGIYGTHEKQKYIWENNKLSLKQGCFWWIIEEEGLYGYNKYEVIGRKRVFSKDKTFRMKENKFKEFIDNIWDIEY